MESGDERLGFCLFEFYSVCLVRHGGNRPSMSCIALVELDDLISPPRTIL